MNLLASPFKGTGLNLISGQGTAILLGCVSILTPQYILTFLLPEY